MEELLLGVTALGTNELICPLRLAASKHGIGSSNVLCIREECAWWAHGGCAITKIANLLDFIKEERLEIILSHLENISADVNKIPKRYEILG